MNKKLAITLFVIIAVVLAVVVILLNPDIFSLGKGIPSFSASSTIFSNEDSEEPSIETEGGVEVILETNLVELLQHIARQRDSRLDRILAEVEQKLSDDAEADFNDILLSTFDTENVQLSRYFYDPKDSNESIIKMLNANAEDALNRIVEILEKRIDQFGLRGSSIQRLGRQRIRFVLPGVKNPDRARDLIGRTAMLEFKFLADSEKVQIFLESVDQHLAGKAGNIKSDSEEAQSLQESLDLTATLESVQTETDDADHPFTSLLCGLRGDIAVPQENLVKVREILADPEIRDLLPEKTEILWAAKPTNVGDQDYHTLYILNSRPELTSAAIENADVEISSGYNDPGSAGQPFVSITMNSRGARIFARITNENIGKRLALILDGAVYMAPVIRSEIPDGRAVIEGLANIDEANDIAILLRSGAFPVSVKLVEINTFNPILDR